MRPKVLLGVLGVVAYLSIGVVVGVAEYRHQSARFDPGFDPLVAAAIAVFFWPVMFANHLRR